MITSECVLASFRETSRYDQLYLRPYETVNYNQGISMMLNEVTEGGRTFDPSSLSSVASNFLGYSAEPAGPANIPEGFDSKRFSFIFKFVDANTNNSGRTVTVLTGYTSHMGATSNQLDPSNISLDPNMRLYFNNLVTLRERPINGPMGIYMETNVISARQILFNHSANDYLSGANSQFALRPMDVMQHMAFIGDPMMSNIREEGAIDASSIINSVCPSSRSNALPSYYMASTMDRYKSSMQREMGQDDFNDTAVWKSAKEKLREPPMSQNPLFRTLMSSGSFMHVGYLTVGDLSRVYPTLDAISRVHYNDSRAKAQEYMPGQASSWAGMNNETVVGNVLQQQVPALMSDSLLANVGFTATNDVVGGQFQVIITGCRSFVEGIDLTPWVQAFQERLITEVLLPASHMGQVSLSVSAEMYMESESRIFISYDGGPSTPYVAPLFCDHLYSPVVSPTVSTIDNVANDFNTMLMDIGGDLADTYRVRPPTNPNTNYSHDGTNTFMNDFKL